MSQQPLVAPNQLAASIRLLRPTPPATRLTVWPFVALYAVLAALLADPTMLWPAWAYEDYAAFIDFFHAVSIPAVAILHALSWFLTKWVVAFGAFVNYTDVGHDTKEATHCLVVPMPHKGETHIAPIAQLPSGSRRRYFEYQQCKFFFDGTVFSPPTYPDSLPVQTYFDQLAQGGLGAVKDGVTDTVAVAAVIEAQLERFGPNYAENRIPDFQTVLFDHLVSPFYVFQIFCVLLLVLDEYWLFAVFNGFMITMLECIQVMQRRRSMQSMNDMGSCPPFPVDVRRNGKVVTVSCRDLLPLDVVHLTFTGSQQCVVPADMVLVRGSAVVNEAMLTGESTPQMKEGLPPVSMSTANAMAEPLCPRLHGHHMVFGGTQILSASAGGSGADSSGNDGGSSAASSAGLPDVAIGIVIRTGFETKQGELIRTIQHSQRRVAQNAGEAFALIGVLLCFAIAASVYVLQRGLANPTKSRWKLFLTCTQILTTVVPPELPLQLTLAATQSMMALMKMNIFCRAVSYPRGGQSRHVLLRQDRNDHDRRNALLWRGHGGRPRYAPTSLGGGARRRDEAEQPCAVIERLELAESTIRNGARRLPLPGGHRRRKQRWRRHGKGLRGLPRLAHHAAGIPRERGGQPRSAQPFHRDALSLQSCAAAHVVHHWR